MRNPSLTRKLTLLVVVGALAATTVAQRGGGRGRNPMPTPRGNYVVVQVENKLSIVRKSQTSWYKQQLGQRYLEEMVQWKEASKTAKKNRIKLEDPKPTKKKLKVVNASSKTEEAARKILEALIEKSQNNKKSKTRLEEGSPLGEAGRGRAGRRRGADRGGAGRGRGEGGDKKGGRDAKKGAKKGDKRADKRADKKGAKKGDKRADKKGDKKGG